MIKKLFLSLSPLFLSLSFVVESSAQPVRDLSRQLEIPAVLSLTSSETHLYALSESEGLVVFRARPDSLQWLYTSSGMQERGNRLQSDIRFAYLFGESRRITVIEPTSVLGVYSSTVLPARPLAAERIGFNLFVTMEDGRLGMINLETPERVDEEIQLADTASEYIIDIASDGINRLYTVTANNRLQLYEVTENEVSLLSNVEISSRTEKLFLVNSGLFGSGRNGSLFSIDPSGNTTSIGSLDSQASDILNWNGLYIIRTSEGSLWTYEPASSELKNWKSGSSAGNHITLSEGTVWVSEFNYLAPIFIPESSSNLNQSSITDSRLRLKEISDKTLPFPRPFIIPIELVNGLDHRNVSFSYSASFSNARIRGNTFFWQPTASQTGRHEVTITASASDGRTDSRTFNLDLRPFNAPPQFSPVRPVTIPGNELFEFQISAFDPDGLDQKLIRFLGVDLPEGAELNERTGLFRWIPSLRQAGEHRFRVIATDQFGAASSQEFEFRVIEVEMDDETEIF